MSFSHIPLHRVGRDDLQHLKFKDGMSNVPKLEANNRLSLVSSSGLRRIQKSLRMRAEKVHRLALTAHVLQQMPLAIA
jgi:hypothetical protein